MEEDGGWQTIILVIEMMIRGDKVVKMIDGNESKTRKEDKKWFNLVVNNIDQQKRKKWLKKDI